MSFLPPIFRLVRPLNLLIAFLSIIAAAALAEASWEQWRTVLLAALTGVFVAAGANAINDYFDVATDSINRPERPIPRGDLTTKQAWVVWAITSAAGLVCSWLTGPYPFGIALVAVALLYLYSHSLKAKPLAGNLLVAFMTGLAFIFGAVAVGLPEAGVMPFVFAFLSNLAREVVKDIEDREGDRASGAATFPIRYGVGKSRLVISIALILLIASTFYAYAEEMYGEAYLWLVIAADVCLAFVAIYVWRSEEPRHMRKMSTMLKVAMVFGLAALWFG